MESVRSATIEGLNKFIHEQQKLPGTCDLRIAQFDNEYEVIYDGDIHTAPTFSEKNYQPRGTTALYDAIGRTVDVLGTGLSWMSESDRPEKVLVAIVTDGHENASHDYNSQKIAHMIGHQQDKYQWNFVFIGANQDAILSAAKLGIQQGHALTYNSSQAGTQNMLRSLTAYTTSVRTGDTDACFTDLDRQQAMQ